MSDYSFADKNSSCVLILSADNDEKAEELFKEKVKNPEYWRMEKL
mgnify:CR=1 FL=1